VGDKAAEEVRHPLFARIFSAGEGLMDRVESENRRELNAGLMGRVLEVGCGSGPNFGYYPTTVTEVVGVEPEEYFRGEANGAAATAPVPVRVVAGVADRLPAENGEFDAVVSSHVLCTVPDQASALAEMARVLRPGGELRFYEHVAGLSNTGRRIQHALDATIWPLVAGGCHCGRDTADAIVAAGFQVQRIRRFQVTAWKLPHNVAPHIIGVAVRP
jgi:SAM-dependent methyltransferase